MTFATCLRNLRSPGQMPDRRRLRRGKRIGLVILPAAVCDLPIRIAQAPMDGIVVIASVH